MKTFKYYLIEAGGAIAGKIEIDKTSLEDAIQWVEEKGFDLNQLPDFSKNYITGLKKNTKQRSFFITWRKKMSGSRFLSSAEN